MTSSLWGLKKKCYTPESQVLSQFGDQLSEFYCGAEAGGEEKAWRAGGRGCLASNQGFQENGRLMQEINLSYNGHVDCQRQGPAPWKSELLKYMISVLFHAHFHCHTFRWRSSFESLNNLRVICTQKSLFLIFSMSHLVLSMSSLFLF